MARLTLLAKLEVCNSLTLCVLNMQCVGIVSSSKQNRKNMNLQMYKSALHNFLGQSHPYCNSIYLSGINFSLHISLYE